MTHTNREPIRTVRFTPYRKGSGPTFTLTIFDTYESGPDGKARLAYTLTQRDIIGAAYCTTFCNFAHDLKTGRPLEHECYVLRPDMLQAEARGEYMTHEHGMPVEPRRVIKGGKRRTEPGIRYGVARVIFDGDDFGCSPLHAIDSDACIRSIMTFLTLRPGDTDAEYFADYTETQLDFANTHAEALDAEVMARFGED